MERRIIRGKREVCPYCDTVLNYGENDIQKYRRLRFDSYWSSYVVCGGCGQDVDVTK